MREKQYVVDELALEESWRMFQIMAEFVEGFNILPDVYPAVSIFGSSQTKPQSAAYKMAVEVAGMLVEEGYNVISGGGPGIMEAANRGASRAGGKSIGMNISLPDEQNLNRYISPELSFIFHYFFMRKFWLVYRAKALVAFPGGFGTLDEVFEILTLVQTDKIMRDHLVILLYGEEYWREVINFEALLKYKTILPEDLKLFSYCSSPIEAFSFLKERLSAFL